MKRIIVMLAQFWLIYTQLSSESHSLTVIYVCLTHSYNWHVPIYLIGILYKYIINIYIYEYKYTYIFFLTLKEIPLDIIQEVLLITNAYTEISSWIRVVSSMISKYRLCLVRLAPVIITIIMKEASSVCLRLTLIWYRTKHSHS